MPFGDDPIIGPSDAQRIANALYDIHRESEKEQDTDGLEENFLRTTSTAVVQKALHSAVLIENVMR